MTRNNEISCELVVIGAGVAGMAASLFASARGIETVQVGTASEIIFASGLLDLLGVHPVEEGKTWNNPWHAIAALSQDLPHHPYARIPPRDIRAALNEFMAFMTRSGLPYHTLAKQNMRVVTPIGTIKRTFAVPHTMKNNADAYKNKTPCLIIDIRGLRGFSARQICETLKPVWPEIHYATIAFPDTDHLNEIYTERLARSLANPATRRQLSQIIKPLINGESAVGLPAVMGMYDTLEILADVQEQTGVAVFEIPTMPPSIPGLRIKELFESRLPEKGVRLLYQHRVQNVIRDKHFFLLKIEDPSTAFTLRAKGVILASGRFIGKGLRADRTRIRESIFDLPVHQPVERAKWHRHHFLDPSGHLINRSGLEIDHAFHPLDASGKAAHENLFAAGSILAHQDWLRMKCGSGLSIATAYAAVQNFMKQ